MSNRDAFNYQDLIDIFARCFATRYNTRLVAGTHEPYYLPAQVAMPAEYDPTQPVFAYHQVVFAHGFYASALHEIAHWCIAGERRRECFDYGYWYAPDGRDEVQQQAFEQVEQKPQALEWLFADAAGFGFQVSVDNLSGIEVDRTAFTQRVAAQKAAYLRDGLPKRAAIFRAALREFYGTNVAKNERDLSSPKQQPAVV